MAQNTEEAVAILKRVPVHMTYNVTLLDRNGDWRTVFVSPDRETEVVKRHAVTNYQHQIEWPQHATATLSYERLNFLEQVLTHSTHSSQVVQGLLTKPLYQDAWLRGYGTLYTAIYRPVSGVWNCIGHNSCGHSHLNSLPKSSAPLFWRHKPIQSCIQRHKLTQNNGLIAHSFWY